MKKFVLSALLLLSSAFTAEARCVGNFCTDENGNSYTVQRFGNTTMMQGWNSGTGSSWSQNSTNFGNSTFHSGTSADGGNWNVQEFRSGNMRTYMGTDSDGNSVFTTCTQFGCN